MQKSAKTNHDSPSPWPGECFAAPDTPQTSSMASLAVLERERRRVLDGLVAIAMEGFAFDPRDAIMRLGPLYHSAKKLNQDPQECFDTAASIAPAPVAEALRTFTRERVPEDRTLWAMGYRESPGTAQPLIYERVPWSEY